MKVEHTFNFDDGEKPESIEVTISSEEIKKIPVEDSGFKATFHSAIKNEKPNEDEEFKNPDSDSESFKFLIKRG